MSLVSWGLWRLASRPAAPRPATMWLAILVTALLFAAGHLPLLFAVVPHAPGWMVVAVIVGNAVLGTLFGWLFWRRGLEAAMLAHLLAHTITALIGN